MKLLLAAAILSLSLCGCMGPQGNPDATPYATEPGGTMAAPPAPPAGEVRYDPSMTQSFADMRVGGGSNFPAPNTPPSRLH